MSKADIVAMAVQLYKGAKDKSVLKFSYEESNKTFSDALIKEAVESSGLQYDGKFTYELFSNPIVKWNLYNLIGVSIEAIIPKTLTTSFDKFCDVQNANWGDQLVFEVSSPDLFTVSKIANGTTNLRRQRLDGRSIKLNPVLRGVKIGEDIFRVLSGKVDWATFVNKVGLSMATAIKNDIYSAIYNSYDAVDAKHFISGSFNGDTLVTLAQRVQAENAGVKPLVFGTNLALSKVTASNGFMSYNMMDEYNNMGYLGTFRGIDLVQLDQVINPSTNDFGINDNFLLVIPSGLDKPVKLGFEGNTIVTENNNQNAAQTVDYVVQKAWDVAILAAGTYGIYRLS